MANHKSADKRARQTIRKTNLNQRILSQVKTNFNRFNDNLSKKNIEEATNSFRLYNSSLSKALKRGIIKKQNVSRKLSSLSDKLKKIS